MHYIYGPKTVQCLSASIDHCKPHSENPRVLHGEYCIPCLPTHQRKSQIQSISHRIATTRFSRHRRKKRNSNTNFSGPTSTAFSPSFHVGNTPLLPQLTHGTTPSPLNWSNSHPNSDSRQLRPLIPVQPNCTLPRPTRLPISFSRYLGTLPTVATTSPKSTSTPASHVPNRKYTLFVRPSRRHEVYHVRPGHD